MKKILIVEDNEIVIELVCLALGKQFDIIRASTTQEAMSHLNLTHFDLLILDVELPDGNGFQICANLRNQERFKNLQIFFLTGKTEIADKVLGFTLGADDYITKPFNQDEFQARVIAKMKRVNEQRKEEHILDRGIFRINYSKQNIYIMEKGTQIDLLLTTIEFKLFSYLITHEDHVLSRDQILNHIWGENIHISDRTVDTHIYTLRKKLGIYSRCIKSVKREGYRFNQSLFLQKTS